MPARPVRRPRGRAAGGAAQRRGAGRGPRPGPGPRRHADPWPASWTSRRRCSARAACAAGQAKATYGTGCFVYLNIGATPRPSTHGLLTTIAWQRAAGVTYALDGGVFARAPWWSGSRASAWSRGPEEVDALAATAGDGGRRGLRAGARRAGRARIGTGRRARPGWAWASAPARGGAGARRARGHRLPRGAGGARDGEGRRDRDRIAARGRRPHRLRHADADAGRPARRARRGRGRHGGHGDGRVFPGRARVPGCGRTTPRSQRSAPPGAGVSSRARAPHAARAAARASSARSRPCGGGMPDAFDVAVIGAGVVGSAVARALSAFELRVVLARSRRRRRHGHEQGQHRHPAHRLRRGARLARGAAGGAWLRADGRLRGRGGHPRRADGRRARRLDRARRCEQLDRARGEGARERLRRRAAAWRRTSVYGMEPHLGPGVRGGLLVPREAILCPFTATLALATEAVVNGVDLRLGAPRAVASSDAERSTGSTCGGEPVEARWVVNAAGLHVRHGGVALRPRRFRVRPRRGELIVFDKLARSLVRPRDPARADRRRPRACWLRPPSSATCSSGPTAVDVDDRDDRSTTRGGARVACSRAARASCPRSRGEEVTATYAGLRAATESSDYQVHFDAERALPVPGRHPVHRRLRLAGARGTRGWSCLRRRLAAEAAAPAAGPCACHRSARPCAAARGRGADRARPRLRPRRVPLRAGDARARSATRCARRSPRARSTACAAARAACRGAARASTAWPGVTGLMAEASGRPADGFLEALA